MTPEQEKTGFDVHLLTPHLKTVSDSLLKDDTGSKPCLKSL